MRKQRSDKKPRIKKQCMNCNTDFEVIHQRKDIARYCSRKCLYEGRDKFTDRIAKVKEARKHQIITEEHKQAHIKAMELRKGIPSWNSGTATIKECICCGTEYKAIGVRKETGKFCSMDCRTKYADQERDENKSLYYRQVWKITESQDLHTLENFDKRGKISRCEDAHHLDHIIPIIYGYENNIPPEVIGGIDNLQFIPAMDNYKKNKSYED